LRQDHRHKDASWEEVVFSGFVHHPKQLVLLGNFVFDGSVDLANL